MGNIRVTKESPTGLNQRFNVGGREIPRSELVKEIRQGKHPDYHVMTFEGKEIPRSNPDKSQRNNLG